MRRPDCKVESGTVYVDFPGGQCQHAASSFEGGGPESPAGAGPHHCLHRKEELQFTDYNLPNPISGKGMALRFVCL